MANDYNEITNRLHSTREATDASVNHIVSGADEVFDDNYPLIVNGYIECDTTPISDPTGNPHEQGWCEEEIIEGTGTGKYILTEDTMVELDKSYYKPIGAKQDAINNQLRITINDLSGIVLHANEYNEATIHEGDNPQANGWYELSDTTYVLTTDTTVVSGKTYYIRVIKITSNEDKIVGKEDGYIPTAGAVGRAMGANFEDSLQSTSTVKGLTANMGRVLNENKADINGYYETMSVGSAKNLDGEAINSEAYLIRPTGGENNEVVSGLASVLGMEGNSCVWNQLIQNGNFSDGTNSWRSRLSGGISVSASNTGLFIKKGNNSNNSISHVVQIVANHKYLFSFDVKNLNGGIQVKKASNANLTTDTTTLLTSSSFNVGGKTSIIFTGAETDANIGFIYINAETELVDSTVLEFDNVTLHDLTLLGINNLTTVAEVEAWLAQYVGTKPYYTYNPGTILSAQTLGIKTYGQNLLNPEDGLAKLIPYTHTTNSNKYTVKGIPTGAAVTYTPDNTGVAVDVTEAITDNTFDISSYGIGTLYIPNATANTYVCMKRNGTMDDEVVSYKDNIYNFDVTKVYGKNNGVEYQCFPNGMRSAGSVKDSLTASEALVKIGSVDLGSLDYTITQTSRGDNYFQGNELPAASRKVSASNVFNGICSKYSALSVNSVYIGNTGIATYNNGWGVRINDPAYSSYTTAQFKTAMSGVMLNYELATPITYTDLIYRDGGIDRPLREVLVNINVDSWSMEEQLMTDYVNGNPTSVPATIQTKYSIDAVEAIKTLEEITYTETEVRTIFGNLLTCLNGEFSEELGGTFVIKDNVPPTPKVFDFEFVENASTNSTEENTETI